MECNKEEAIRAKEIAEKKMESKDFAGARKFAMRAQQLYADLKDIAQMILVCDVHCAAQNKIYGGEKDWYGILQVGPTVDEAAIRKQYRKLALLLHPDKNQLAGAADAFKFIGEAQKVLVDHEKRIVYDSKCGAAGRSQVSNLATRRGSRQSNARTHPWFQNSFVHNAASNSMGQQSQQEKDQPKIVPGMNRATFWTVCPFCAVRYQYYKELVNKPLVCQSCKKRFIGYEANAPSSSAVTSSAQAKFPQKKGSVRQCHPSAIPKSTSTWFSSETSNLGSTTFEKVKMDPPVGTTVASGADKKSVLHDDIKNTNVKTANKRKKKNKSAESSDSCETLNSTDTEEDCVIQEDADDQFGRNSGHHSEQNLRRSTRSKRKISYDEYLSDDEFAKPSKKSKSSEDVNLDADSFAQDVVGTTTSFAGDYVVPDPDFNDFDSEKSLDKFQVGQIWALYSDEDTLPKYYGFITKINSAPNFGLHMTWLASVTSKDIIQWVDKSMPISCGLFKVARKKSQKYDNASPFSHQIRVQLMDQKDVYAILPQTGDIWAMYKGWNENLTCSDLELCEYEIVEVLEASNSSINVLLLEQVKDYTSVFKPQMRGESGLNMQIPRAELLRFSHQIPAVRLLEEKEGTLSGFWELDPAALPVYFFL